MLNANYSTVTRIKLNLRSLCIQKPLIRCSLEYKLAALDQYIILPIWKIGTAKDGVQSCLYILYRYRLSSHGMIIRDIYWSLSIQFSPLCTGTPIDEFDSVYSKQYAIGQMGFIHLPPPLKREKYRTEYGQRILGGMHNVPGPRAVGQIWGQVNSLYQVR